MFTHAELAAEPIPSGSEREWSLAQRARASFNPARSGDLVVLLRPQVTPIATPAKGYVATHGSPWDYDRRVPLLFWQAGRPGFEQPQPVGTVDILPTLAALVGLPMAETGHRRPMPGPGPGDGDDLREVGWGWLLTFQKQPSKGPVLHRSS